MPEFDAQQVAGLREGEVLAGKYRVENVLGHGGNGVVVSAHHLTLDEKVAIKFLRPEMLEDSAAVNRFLREGRAAVKIKSEFVARVFDVGTLESGAPYIVMEFLEGGDLADWLKQRGPPTIEQTVEFVLQACVAVAEAHRLGIVHRDLKPANLFCLRRPDGQLTVKVLDFGISKMSSLRGAISGTETGPAAFLGSPFYMSPEQMRAAPDMDTGTDIWALGVILYELLTGKVPFHGTTIAELATKVAAEDPPRLRGLRPEVPAGLETAVLRCLKKDRAARFSDVAALAAAIQEFGPKRAAMYVERIAGTLDSTSPSGGGWGGPSSKPASGPRSEPGSGPGRASVPSDGWPPAGTDSSMGSTVARGARRRTGVFAVVALAAAAGVGAALIARGPDRVARATGDSGSFSAALPPPVASVAIPVESLPPVPSGTRVPSPPATARLDSPPADVARTNPGPVAPRPRPAPPAARPAPTASGHGSSKDCRLVSFFDSEGNQHFKEDCSGN
jgi:serine/threonine-protein kinase